MGFAHRAFVAAGVGFAVSAIVGCGSSGGSLLTASQSNSLSEQLNRVTQALDDQRCSQARQYLADFRSNVDSLGGVDSTLIANLDQGASTIQTLAARDCQTPANTTPKKTHPKTTTSTTQTATGTTQTFTTPSTATYTQPAYTQPTYTNPPTNTTGGTCPSCATTTTNTSTTQSTTTSNGGTGLGGGDTSTSGAITNGTGTGAAGGGF
jgi:hypothetical protein